MPTESTLAGLIKGAIRLNQKTHIGQQEEHVIPQINCKNHNSKQNSSKNQAW